MVKKATRPIKYLTQLAVMTKNAQVGRMLEWVRIRYIA